MSNKKLSDNNHHHESTFCKNKNGLYSIKTLLLHPTPGKKKYLEILMLVQTDNYIKTWA